MAAAGAPPAGFDARLLEFAEALRAEGVAVGTSGLLDAFAVLDVIGWTDQGQFREALAATLAKSPEDRRIFELLFERFFFRAVEAEAIRRQIKENDAGDADRDDGITGGEQIDYDALREAVVQAIRDGDESTLRDLARLSIAAFGRRSQGSGVLGVDVQRIRRALGLKSEPGGRRPATRAGRCRRPTPPKASPATRSAASSATCAPSSSGRRSSARRSCRRPGRSTSSTARCRPGRCRTSPPCTASSPSSSAGWPPRARRTAANAARPRRRAPHDARDRWRPAACRSSSRPGRCARAARRSSSCATCRPR
jgi:hypothetical protein